MSTKTKSRWADNEEDVAIEAHRKKEKEEKKRIKAGKQRKVDEITRPKEQEAVVQSSIISEDNGDVDTTQNDPQRPAKRRRLSTEPEAKNGFVEDRPTALLRFPAPGWSPCRHVDNFEKLNHIEEGSYGWVSRARETNTGEIVALKKLKMDISNDGFPVTGLREIQTLMESRHTNIVNLREVVMGDSMNE